jgi:hypothetical protein
MGYSTRRRRCSRYVIRNCSHQALRKSHRSRQFLLNSYSVLTLFQHSGGYFCNWTGRRLQGKVGVPFKDGDIAREDGRVSPMSVRTTSGKVREIAIFRQLPESLPGFESEPPFSWKAITPLENVGE